MVKIILHEYLATLNKCTFLQRKSIMEILLLVILAGLAGWFLFLRNDSSKKTFTPTSAAAPYKIETPVLQPDPVDPPSTGLVSESAVAAEAKPVLETVPVEPVPEVKKTRQSRKPKAEKTAKAKTVKKKSAPAIKATKTRTKKA